MSRETEPEERCPVSELPRSMCADCRRDTHGAKGRLKSTDLVGVSDDPWSIPSSPASARSWPPRRVTAEHDSTCVGCEQRIRPGQTLVSVELNEGQAGWVHDGCENLVIGI